MATSNPLYRRADAELRKLFRLLERRFQNFVTRADWDELNVLQEIDSIYSDVEVSAEQAYLTVAQESYKRASDEILAILPGKKEAFDLPTALFIAGLLDGYDDKTLYVYRHELDRKRARLKESLLAINDQPIVFNSNATREALKRAIALFERQMRNMADTVTDEARRQAFSDAGVDFVKWHTQEDEKVCPICLDRNGQEYPLYSVPAKHFNCRCYLTPILRRSED